MQCDGSYHSPDVLPIAAKKPHTVTHHGITVTDDYAWLRDPGYPEVTDKAVLAHLEAENAWFEARMAPHKPLVDTLFKEMRGRIKEADKSVPQKDGDWLYWIEFEEGAEYKKWWRRPVAGGPDQLILDEAALAEGKEYFRLGAIVGQPGRPLLAYAVDDNGSERFTARVQDLATGEMLPRRNPRHPVLAGLGRGRHGPRLFASPTSTGAPTMRGSTGSASRSKATSSSTTRTTRAFASARRFRPTSSG